jgi:RNA recognition motif-containing protein
MQSSSSGGDRNSRNSRPRGARSGSRNGRSGGRGGEGRRDFPRKSDGPEEFRPSEHADRKPRRESSKPAPAPKPTAFQKFIKIITFGLVDPTAKKTTPSSSSKPTREPREPRAPRGDKEDSGVKRERRAPLYVEPTTPRLYIGNLSYDVTNADLEVLFAAHGSVVEAAVVTQSGSDKSKGFAFVEMSSVEEAKAAAVALNDHEVQGRKMLVTGAKSEGREEKPAGRGERGERGPRPERGERSGGRSGERGGRGGRTRGGDSDEIDKPSRQVRALEIETVTSPSLNVTNLNSEASDVDITDLFAGIGSIVHREETGPGKDERTKNHRIDLAETAEAQKAVELLHGKCFMGHEIAVTGVKTEA